MDWAKAPEAIRTNMMEIKNKGILPTECISVSSFPFLLVFKFIDNGRGKRFQIFHESSEKPSFALLIR